MKTTVGDIMFVELKDNVKKPLLIHVDVCTKLITGVSLNNKSDEECMHAVLAVKADYALLLRYTCSDGIS